MLATRLAQLQRRLEQRNLQALAIIPSRTMYYLSALTFHLLERPIVGFFPSEGKPLLVVPDLERTKAEASPLEPEVISYAEDETSRLKAFSSAAKKLHLEKTRIGIEPLSMRAFELWLLQKTIPRAEFVPADEVIAAMRLIKDEKELQAMRQAVAIAQTALEKTIPLIKLGMTELELSSELVMQLLRAGSQAELAFQPIIASGPNSAFVHAVPGERKLQLGDLLMLDFGARFRGYVSDLTRTFALGETDPELAQVYEAVRRANQAGVAAVQPGVRCQEVDFAARSVIEAAGYGKYFIHRTGHGIGLDEHEDPYISSANEQLLQPGMTFTVEPGIYLPGRGGVRIEDNVFVTQESGERLSSFPREIQVIL